MKTWFAALALMLVSLPSLAADACAEGDQKCGADGYVLECKRVISYADAKWWRKIPSTKCQGPAADSAGSSSWSYQQRDNKQLCTDGATQRDVNGNVQRCRNGRWE